jgi:hypothetical protein
MGDALTKPEHETERALAKRIRDRMANVCDHCIHRVTHWGHSHCPKDDRKFPACVETPGINFELDERTIRG